MGISRHLGGTMNFIAFRLSILILLAFLIIAPPCWAKEKGYLYVVGYSFSQKKVFYSSVVMQKVPNVSYDEREYTTDIMLIRDMESQFQKYLVSTVWINPEEYTISARGAYKRKEFAEKAIEDDKGIYLNKGFQASVLNSFVYED